MTDLDAPDDPDDLYLARGDVTIALPIMQGDVYDGVTVPGLSEEPLTVAIVMHPCSMRAGAHLRAKRRRLLRKFAPTSRSATRSGGRVTST